jgi:hypothetical protein
MIQTKRRTPTPTNITLAGENTCKNALNGTDLTRSCYGTYQANTFSEGFRKRIEDIDGRVQPFGQPFIVILRSIELLNLLLKHNENATGRVAGLELGGEWVGKKVLLCATLICSQGIIEYLLEVGGRCGSRVGVKHNGGSEEDDVGLRVVGEDVSTASRKHKRAYNRQNIFSCSRRFEPDAGLMLEDFIRIRSLWTSTSLWRAGVHFAVHIGYVQNALDVSLYHYLINLLGAAQGQGTVDLRDLRASRASGNNGLPKIGIKRCNY